MPNASFVRSPAQSLTQSRRLRGKAVDVKGQITLRKTQLILYGTPKRRSRRRAAPAPDAVALFVAVTDPEGNFSMPHPGGEYTAAWFVLATAPDSPVPVVLDDDQLPEFIYVIAELPDDMDQEEHDDCACKVPCTPRLPDELDFQLTNTYQQDIGGSCMNLTTPNRALEEFSFYSVVRTTDPEVGPLDLHEIRAAIRELDAEIRRWRRELAKLPLIEVRPDMVPMGMNDGGPVRRGAPIDPEDQKDRGGADSSPPPPDGSPKPPLPGNGGGQTGGPGVPTKPGDGTSPSKYDALTLTNRIRDLQEQRNGLASLLTIDRAELNAANALDWDSEAPLLQATTISHGHLLHFKQVWRADGYSLGDLVYSLPLAPGQKKRIAVFDWNRGETASRTEDQTFDEALTNELSRDRDIKDIVDSTLEEKVEGKSKSTNVGFSMGSGGGGGAAAKGNMGFMNVAGNAGFSHGTGFNVGHATTSGWQDSSRSVSAKALNSLRDRTMQAASATRSSRASTVMAIEQHEQVRVQTEHVANYNHCHAITIQYFEVLRHFALHNELADVQECLFVPLLMKPFDTGTVTRWREVLQRAVYDSDIKGRKRLADSFAATERWHRFHVEGDSQTYNAFPKDRYADEPLTDLSGTLNFELHFARPPVLEPDALEDSLLQHQDDIDEWQRTMSWLPGWTTLRNRVLKPLEVQRRIRMHEALVALNLIPEIKGSDLDTAFQTELRSLKAVDHLAETLGLVAVTHDGTRIPLPVEVTPTPWNTWSKGRRGSSAWRVGFTIRPKLTPTGNVPPLPDRAAIAAVEITSSHAAFSAGTSLRVRGVNLRYATAHHNHRLVLQGRMNADLAGHDGLKLDTPLDAEETRDIRLDDAELKDFLLQRLNGEIEYYHSAIWWNMDPRRRQMLLEGFHLTVPGRWYPDADNNGQLTQLPDSQISVASCVENRLLGISGNTLIFPVAKGYNLDPFFRFDTDRIDVDGVEVSRLMHHYMPPQGFRVAPFRVSVPTRGVFAEAVMGACNSCETKDDTKYWRWEESPIPDNPTEIQSIDMSSRMRDPGNMQVKDMPAPIVQVQQAPAAPDPTGLAGAMALLGKQGLFQDAMGIEGTQANAMEAAKEAGKSARHYADKAAELAQSASAMLNGDKISKSIQDFLPGEDNKGKREGLLTDLLHQQIGPVPGGGGSGGSENKSGFNMLDDGVQGVLNAAKKAQSGGMKFQSPDGESFEANFDGGEESQPGSGSVGGSTGGDAPGAGAPQTDFWGLLQQLGPDLQDFVDQFMNQ